MNPSIRSRLTALSAWALLILMSACGGSGSSGSSGPTVSSATVGTARYGTSVLITVNGSGLANNLALTSTGCSGMSRSTKAPNISGDTVAYYNCLVTGIGSHSVNIARSSDGVSLARATFKVPMPVVTVSPLAGNSLFLGDRLLIKVEGGTFGTDLALSSPGCTGFFRSTSAPNASTDTLAYYTCIASVLGQQMVSVARASDGYVLGNAIYTVAASPSGIRVSTGEARYGSNMLVTVSGQGLGADLTVESPGCRDMTRSTTAPYVSNDTMAFYNCTVSAVGTQPVNVSRDDTVLGSATFNAPAPQVTMDITNGGSINGSLVFTLAPDKTPVTVDNFLAYVNSGYYDNTVFHRVVNSPNPFVIQGGAYLRGSTMIKPGQRAPIELEVNRGLNNVQWSVAMARTDAANSATSQFFINLVDNPSLNPSSSTAGYAVFGSVTANTALVSAIAGVACAQNALSQCWPVQDVVVTRAVQTR